MWWLSVPSTGTNVKVRDARRIYEAVTEKHADKH
jgi:hypothetical protein